MRCATPSEEPQPLRLNERVRISMPPDHPAAALDQKVGYAKTWLPKKGVYLVLVPPERTQLLQFKPNKLCRIDPTLQEWEERRDAAAPERLRNGSLVELKGLVNRAELNGRRGVVTGYSGEGKPRLMLLTVDAAEEKRIVLAEEKNLELIAGSRGPPQRDEIPVVDALAERLRPVTDEQGGPLSDDAALLASLVSVVEEGFDGAWVVEPPGAEDDENFDDEEARRARQPARPPSRCREPPTRRRRLRRLRSPTSPTCRRATRTRSCGST